MRKVPFQLRKYGKSTYLEISPIEEWEYPRLHDNKTKCDVLFFANGGGMLAGTGTMFLVSPWFAITTVVGLVGMGVSLLVESCANQKEFSEVYSFEDARESAVLAAGSAYENADRLRKALSELPNGRVMYAGIWTPLRDLGLGLLEHIFAIDNIDRKLALVAAGDITELGSKLESTAQEHEEYIKQVNSEIGKLADSAGELVLVASVNSSVNKALGESGEIQALNNIVSMREYFDAMKQAHTELAPVPERKYLGALGTLDQQELGK